MGGSWLKADVYFSVGPVGEFSVSHLQGVEGPVPIWLSFVHSSILVF
jgi:hypothetical protein